MNCIFNVNKDMLNKKFLFNFELYKIMQSNKSTLEINSRYKYLEKWKS